MRSYISKLDSYQANHFRISFKYESLETWRPKESADG